MFPQTNVNCCFFQQFKTFQKWWVPVEAEHGLGFSARILTSFTRRAVVTREYGFRDEASIAELMQHIWRYVALKCGHHIEGPMTPFQLSGQGESAFMECYFRLAELEQRFAWSSALEAALGKFEYWGPCVAMLTYLQEAAWARSPDLSPCLSDEALKCGIRCFDARVCLGCAVIDHEVSATSRRTDVGGQGGSMSMKRDVPFAARLTEMEELVA